MIIFSAKELVKNVIFLKLLQTAIVYVNLIQYIEGFGSCPRIPKSCSTDLITFHLFNRNYPNGIQLSADGDNGNNDGELFTNEQVKLIFHGYSGGMNNPRMVQLREAYLKSEKYSNINIIHVDYEKLSQSGCYWTLVQSLNIIGKCTAEFIKTEIMENGIAINRLHPIGFSFGAHAAAVTSEKIRDVGIFERLTGIEPALPAFTFPFAGSWHKLNRSHATFVDVIHTNAWFRGVYSSDAHFDFYGNNGVEQNGCHWLDTLCSHARALDYYIESVDSEIGFHAVKCSLLNIFMGWCKFESMAETKAVLVGEPCSPPQRESDAGSYHFPTKEDSPYAMGKPTSTKQLPGFGKHSQN